MSVSADESNPEDKSRGAFSSRRLFILAAIGSAVGLGNIWRFPYVAYENGGGAFMIPYIVALLAAGLPFLMLDYCFAIAIYYAAITGSAAVYAIFSFDKSWGQDSAMYFSAEFLESAAKPDLSMNFVSGLLIQLVLVWGRH